MSNVSIKLNKKGVRELLNSPGAVRDLDHRARRIAAAANAGMKPPAGEGMAGVDHFEIGAAETGKNRAHAAVFTRTREAKYAEAKQHKLTRAVGAGRG